MNQDRKRTNSRITYAATAQGIEKAEQALRRLGIASKVSFAELCDLSRSTITKFFGGKPIEQSGFITIFEKLELSGDWIEIADIENSDNNGKVKSEQDSCNQIDDNQISIAITASISQKDLAKYKSISKLLKRLADDDFIEIVDVEEGSIKLTLKGSTAGLQRLEELFQSGKLTKIFKQKLNITVENVSFIAPQNSDEERQNQTATTENQQLAFTIAGNVSQADINTLKSALIDTSDDEKSELPPGKKPRVSTVSFSRQQFLSQLNQLQKYYHSYQSTRDKNKVKIKADKTLENLIFFLEKQEVKEKINNYLSYIKDEQNKKYILYFIEENLNSFIEQEFNLVGRFGLNLTDIRKITNNLLNQGIDDLIFDTVELQNKLYKVHKAFFEATNNTQNFQNRSKKKKHKKIIRKAVTKVITGLGIITAISTEDIDNPIALTYILLGISELIDGQHDIFKTEFNYK